MKLRLGPLPDAKPVRLTVTLSLELKETLEDYAKLHGELHGQTVTPEALIPAMLQAFIAKDVGFRQARRPASSP